MLRGCNQTSLAASEETKGFPCPVSIRHWRLREVQFVNEACGEVLPDRCCAAAYANVAPLRRLLRPRESRWTNPTNRIVRKRPRHGHHERRGSKSTHAEHVVLRCMLVASLRERGDGRLTPGPMPRRESVPLLAREVTDPDRGSDPNVRQASSVSSRTVMSPRPRATSRAPSTRRLRTDRVRHLAFVAYLGSGRVAYANRVKIEAAKSRFDRDAK